MVYPSAAVFGVVGVALLH